MPLRGCFRVSSPDYDDLPEITWITILTIFTRAGRGDELIDALEGLVNDDGDI